MQICIRMRLGRSELEVSLSGKVMRKPPGTPWVWRVYLITTTMIHNCIHQHSLVTSIGIFKPKKIPLRSLMQSDER